MKLIYKVSRLEEKASPGQISGAALRPWDFTGLVHPGFFLSAILSSPPAGCMARAPPLLLPSPLLLRAHPTQRTERRRWSGERKRQP